MSSFQETSQPFWNLIKTQCFAVPNFWDYLDFDDFLYDLMAQDIVRNDAYREVLRQKVDGKTIIEIGPGSQLVLTLMAAEAGAKKIYAVEMDEEAYHNASALVVEKGLTETIELIHANSDDVVLPEKVDVCLSEIIGTIGNSEGATRFLREAKRFLKPSGIMIPEGVKTWLSPVCKPTEVYQDQYLSDLIAHYTQLAQENIGDTTNPFPMYEYWNFPSANLISQPQILEEYWFNEDLFEDVFEKRLTFEVAQNTLFDGLLLWMNLAVDPEHVIGPFLNMTHWSSVYIPVKPCQLSPGDVIEINCHVTFDANKLHPDYAFDLFVNNSKVMSIKDLL